MNIDRTTERQFLQQLLAATRSGRAVWTGTVRPGWFQYNVGEHLLAISSDPAGSYSLSLYHCSGNLLEILTPALIGGDTADASAVFAELYELSRIQALNLGRRWRRLAVHLRQEQGAPPADPA